MTLINKLNLKESWNFHVTKFRLILKRVKWAIWGKEIKACWQCFGIQIYCFDLPFLRKHFTPLGALHQFKINKDNQKWWFAALSL